MKVINDAYTTLMQQHGFVQSPLASGQAKAPPEGQRRLSREEIDAMVAAIGSGGPLDGFLDGVGWVGSTISAVFTALFLLGLVFRIVVTLRSGNWRELLADPGDVLLVGVIVILCVKEYVQRRRLGAVGRDQDRVSR